MYRFFRECFCVLHCFSCTLHHWVFFVRSRSVMSGKLQHLYVFCKTSWQNGSISQVNSCNTFLCAETRPLFSLRNAAVADSKLATASKSQRGLIRETLLPKKLKRMSISRTGFDASTMKYYTFVPIGTRKSGATCKPHPKIQTLWGDHLSRQDKLSWDTVSAWQDPWRAGKEETLKATFKTPRSLWRRSLQVVLLDSPLIEKRLTG